MKICVSHGLLRLLGNHPSPGDLKTLEDYLQSGSGTSIDDKDAKGISCLGYAIGANRTHVVKKLLENKALGW